MFDELDLLNFIIIFYMSHTFTYQNFYEILHYSNKAIWCGSIASIVFTHRLITST